MCQSPTIKRNENYMLSAFKELNHITEHYNIILHITQRYAKVILKSTEKE